MSCTSGGEMNATPTPSSAPTNVETIIRRRRRTTRLATSSKRELVIVRNLIRVHLSHFRIHNQLSWAGFWAQAGAREGLSNIWRDKSGKIFCKASLIGSSSNGSPAHVSSYESSPCQPSTKANLGAKIGTVPQGC